MNIQDRMDLKKAKNVLIQSNDPRFNFAVAPANVIDDFPKIPEIIPMEKYDYGFKKDDGDETRLPELSKLSMITSCSSLEDLECWYREKHPNLPDEFHGVMARYSAGPAKLYLLDKWRSRFPRFLAASGVSSLLIIIV